MRPITSWNFTPYSPLNRPDRLCRPYICRLAPGRTSVNLDFIDWEASASSHTLLYREKGSSEPFVSCGLSLSKSAVLKNLRPFTDYEICIERDSDGVKSELRLFRTDEVPGIVVNSLHPEDDAYSFSGHFLCSPCLIRLPSGRLLSSMDVFGRRTPQNLTLIFRSDDNGETWQYVTELFPCFWGRMFYQNGRLYMLAVSNEYGDLLIGGSDDDGENWTVPTVLFRGSSHNDWMGFHRAPMPVLSAKGRLWTDVQFGAWTCSSMSDAVLSAPDDCKDYTDPSVWRLSEFWDHNKQIDLIRSGKLHEACAGGIEGNLVISPDGTLIDFLRYDHKKCLLLKIDDGDPEAMPVYDRLVDMEITPSKFEIQWDDESRSYWSLCSRALDELHTVRNVLSLFRSDDLIHWRCVADILDRRYEDPSLIGFQYVSFLIEDRDILFLSRTAYGKPANFHDTNYQTFHVIHDFRTLDTETLTEGSGFSAVKE